MDPLLGYVAENSLIHIVDLLVAGSAFYLLRSAGPRGKSAGAIIAVLYIAALASDAWIGDGLTGWEIVMAVAGVGVAYGIGAFRNRRNRSN